LREQDQYANFNNFHAYSKLTAIGGMDACDKVSQLLKCGRENSPELLIELMNNLENAITVY